MSCLVMVGETPWLMTEKNRLRSGGFLFGDFQPI